MLWDRSSSISHNNMKKKKNLIGKTYYTCCVSSYSRSITGAQLRSRPRGSHLTLTFCCFTNIVDVIIASRECKDECKDACEVCSCVVCDVSRIKVSSQQNLANNFQRILTIVLTIGLLKFVNLPQGSPVPFQQQSCRCLQRSMYLNN